MTAPVEVLASYVPPTVARRCAEHPFPPSGPIAERLNAAILFADIVGFVTLTERLAQQGRAGAEEISRELNARFGRFIDVITTHGGEVVTFAGDALIASWPTSGSDETLVVRTLRAVQCGLALLRGLRDDESPSAKSPALRVGVAAGDLLETHVGGVGGQWEFVLVGPPLVHVGTAQRLARGGHVVVTPEAWALVNEYCAGHHVGSGFMRIDDVRLPPDPRPFASLQMPSSGAAALRAYVPAGVLSRLDAGQAEWLAELRRGGLTAGSEIRERGMESLS